MIEGERCGRGSCVCKETATTEIYTLSLHDALPICLAKYGAMGLWALYIDDQPLFERYAAAYDQRLRQHFTADGIALVGGNYASARLAGSELAKTYFMDVLTRVGWHDYYADPLLGNFYEIGRAHV